MKNKEKTNTGGSQQNNGSNFPFEKCQEMMQNYCGNGGSFNCNEMMQNMFGSTSKEEDKQ